MDDPLEVSRRHWDELAALHPSTDGYDVDGLLEFPDADVPLTFSLRATKPPED